jgi:Uma2 family endonuclease
MQIYARHRVARYWIVDVDQRTIESYALREAAYELVASYSGDDVARFDVPEGLVLALGEIWPRD